MSDVPQDIIDELINQYLAEQEGPMLTGEQATMYGAMPQLNLEGDPYTLNNQLNQLQDLNQLIADPVFQGTGGLGGFSRESFTPRVRMEVVDSPEYVRWQNYLNSPTRSRAWLPWSWRMEAPHRAPSARSAKGVAGSRRSAGQRVGSAVPGGRWRLGPVPGKSIGERSPRQRQRSM